MDSLESAFTALCTLIRDGTNGGAVKPIISVFPARGRDGVDPVRIWNKQLVFYAGYKGRDGSVVGDADSVALTKVGLKIRVHRNYHQVLDKIAYLSIRTIARYALLDIIYM